MNHADLNDETKLKKITIVLLKAECDRLKIVYSSKVKKAELVELILEHDHKQSSAPSGGHKVAQTKTKITMPKGTYFLGDPCYAVHDELWSTWLDDAGMDGTILFAKVKGKDVLGFTTAYGDGCYLDQLENQYGVDAGMIGLTPIEVMDVDEKELKRLMTLGTFVTFFDSVECETINNGATLKFGKYVINTGDED